MEILYRVLTFVYLITALVIMIEFVRDSAAVGGLENIGRDAASAVAVLFVYAVVLVSVDSAPEFTQTIFGGLPYVSEIADFGSLAEIWNKSPQTMVVCFFDVVVLSALMDLLKPIFGVTKNLPMSMTKVFSHLVVSVVAMFILNFIIKKTEAYSAVVTTIGGIVTAFTSVTVLLTAIASLSTYQVRVGAYVLAALTFRNPVTKLIHASFFKAVLYVITIAVMEHFCGGFSGAVALGITLASAFVPVIIMLLAFRIMLKSLK